MEVRSGLFREWRLVFAVSAILILISGIPYLYGFWRTPAGSTYTGLHALTPGDFHVYYTQMRLAAEGEMSTVNPYAGADGVGSMSMLNPFWYMLGMAAKTAHLSFPLVFHIARLAMIPALVIAVYRLIEMLLPRPFRVSAGTIALLGSGLGYFVLPFLNPSERPHIYPWPLDLWVPESNTFLTLYHSPHLLASLILFLFILLAFLKSLTAPRPWQWQTGAGCAAALLGYFHPFHLITLAAVLTLWTLILGRRALVRTCVSLALIGLMALPSVWWQWGRATHDWVTMEWARGNINLTPPFWTVAAGYGLLLPLAFTGIFSLRQSLTDPDKHMPEQVQTTAPWLLLSWVGAQLILIYSPLIFQRRLIEGMHVPLALLAGAGVASITHYVQRRSMPAFMRSVLIACLWLLLLSSTLGTVSRDAALFRQQEARFYFSPELRHVWEELRGQRDQDGVVLAGYTSANFIPAWTGRSVFGAPGGAHSPLFEEARRPLISWFIAGKGSQAQRQRFLRRERVTAVVVSPLDGVDPSALARDPLLYPRYSRNGTQLYFVR